MKKIERIAIQNQINIICNRKFELGAHYEKKHLDTMIVKREGEIPNVYIPKFWDDATLTKTELDSVDWFVGLEIHKYRNVIAFYGINRRNRYKKYLGPIIFVENNPQGLLDFEKKVDTFGFHVNRVVMETTSIYHFYFGWNLEKSLGKDRVVVMNAKYVKDYMPKIHKNDKSDAIRLSQIASIEELIIDSYIFDENLFALRELTRQREKTVHQYARTKVVIKKMLSTVGFTYKFNFQVQKEVDLVRSFLKSDKPFKHAYRNFSNKKFIEKRIDKLEKFAEINPSENYRANIELMFAKLELDKLMLDLIESKILHDVEKYDGISKNLSLLKHFTGFGLLSQISAVVEIGNIKRFPSANRFIAYCGIGPSSESSGVKNIKNPNEKAIKGDKPNPWSNRILKGIFVQTAGNILRDSKRKTQIDTEDDLYIYARRFWKDKRPYFKKTFKIASKLARKFYHCLCNQQVYNPNYEQEKLQKSDNSSTSSSSCVQKPPKRVLNAIAKKRLDILKRDYRYYCDQIEKLSIDPASKAKVQNIYTDFIKSYIIF